MLRPRGMGQVTRRATERRGVTSSKANERPAQAAPCRVPRSHTQTSLLSSGEGKLLIQHNHVLAGCVDKNCFGKHGLLHFFHVRTLIGEGLLPDA